MTRLLDYLICAIAATSLSLAALESPAEARSLQQSSPQKSTPGSQGTRSDAEITRLVRQSVQQDKALSPLARKVQISTLACYVTLKGQVRSPEERAAVEAKAAQIAGDDYVMSQLTVPKGAASPPKSNAPKANAPKSGSR